MSIKISETNLIRIYDNNKDIDNEIYNVIALGKDIEEDDVEFKYKYILQQVIKSDEYGVLYNPLHTLIASKDFLIKNFKILKEDGSLEDIEDECKNTKLKEILDKINEKQGII